MDTGTAPLTRALQGAPSWDPESLSRLPPGMSLPSIRPANAASRTPAIRLGATIGDYRDAHRMYTMGLLTMPSSPPVPPGHPLYAQNSTLGVLRDENERLKAENTKLRDELEHRTRESGGQPRPA